MGQEQCSNPLSFSWLASLTIRHVSERGVCWMLLKKVGWLSISFGSSSSSSSVAAAPWYSYMCWLLWVSVLPRGLDRWAEDWIGGGRGLSLGGGGVGVGQGHSMGNEGTGVLWVTRIYCNNCPIKGFTQQVCEGSLRGVFGKALGEGTGIIRVENKASVERGKPYVAEQLVLEQNNNKSCILLERTSYQDV